MIFHDGLTASARGEWALCTGSPHRAVEGELGVQDSDGFWDPAGSRRPMLQLPGSMGGVNATAGA